MLDLDEYNELVSGCLVNPLEDLPRLVLADWLEDRYENKLAEDIRNIPFISKRYWIGGDVGDGDGGVDGDGSSGVGGDGGGDGGVGDGSGVGGGGDGGGDGGVGDGGGDGDGSGKQYKDNSENISLERTDMKDGLYILVFPGGYYPWVFVTWVKLKGLEIEMHNCRVIRRFGQNAQLSMLAKKGPQVDTQLLEPSKVEYQLRTNISRNIPACPEKWRKECPKPKNWEEDNEN